jgi:hypothetical protein
MVLLTIFFPPSEDQPQIGGKNEKVFISLLRPKTTFYCLCYNFSTLFSLPHTKFSASSLNCTENFLLCCTMKTTKQFSNLRIVLLDIEFSRTREFVCLVCYLIWGWGKECVWKLAQKIVELCRKLLTGEDCDTCAEILSLSEVWGRNQRKWFHNPNHFHGVDKFLVAISEYVGILTSTSLTVARQNTP